jgi:hypothetical protein
MDEYKLKEKIMEKPKENLKIRAEKLIDRFSNDPFNGIDIAPTIESHEEWSEDYAIFILDCDLDDFFPIDGNDYQEVNYTKYYEDLREFLKKWFGEDVVIKHCPACNEWEVYRS